MDNKHRKLFVIEQRKGCKFMPKMQQNTFGGRALSAPDGKFIRSLRSPSRNKPTYKGNGGMGEGLLVRETDGREGNSPKVKVRVE